MPRSHVGRHRAISGSTGNVNPCLLQPSGRVQVADQIEKPPKQSQPIIAAKPEAGGVPSERIGEGPRIVECAADGIGDDVRHSLGIFLVVQEI